ncbi:hypothetical protein N7G274_007951 [Stereocaulon virgatum]|uniref:TFIID-31kDa-domain-containing protein n=1 Tax=Stereocaulon virgatum TaxID=373712 RepID=A0ABR4A0Z3_9LECA
MRLGKLASTLHPKRAQLRNISTNLLSLTNPNPPLLLHCAACSHPTMASLNGAPSELDPQPPTNISPPTQPTTTSTAANPSIPPTSTLDSGLTKRPNNARLLHMILSNYGVTAYQERVPLQLLDFAYRYTASTLQDALHFTSEGYGTTSSTGAGAGAAGSSGRKGAENAAAHHDLSAVTLSALRLSIASRTHYQFNSTLPKEFYGELAAERNRVALPGPQKEWGMRLPPEQYCLLGVGWELKEEWDEEMGDADEGVGVGVMEEGEDGEGGEDEEEEEGGRMEDIFGGGADGGDADREMEG